MIKALILSGGAGNELLPLTINTPKPLLPVGNFPLLLYQIYRLKQAGITEVILSLPYQPRKIRDIFNDGSDFGVILRCHWESTPLGTAGAFKAAEHLIDDTTIVLNGDILTELPLQECLAAHQHETAVATIGACSVSDPRRYGVLEIDDGGKVTRFVERPRGSAPRTHTINAGVYILEPEVLEWIPAHAPFFFESDLFPDLLRRKVPFVGYVFAHYWMEITRPDNYLQCNMDFLDRKITLPEFPAFSKTHHPPNRPDVKVDQVSWIDEQCILKAGTQIEHSVVGANCRIEEDAQVRNSVIWPGCRIQRDAVISGTILGRGCLVGEGARLRAGNLIGDRSTLTSHSKT